MLLELVVEAHLALLPLGPLTASYLVVPPVLLELVEVEVAVPAPSLP